MKKKIVEPTESSRLGKENKISGVTKEVGPDILTTMVSSNVQKDFISPLSVLSTSSEDRIPFWIKGNEGIKYDEKFSLLKKSSFLYNGEEMYLYVKRPEEFQKLLTSLNEDQKQLMYLNRIHSRANNHLSNYELLLQHLKSQSNYQELLNANYADLLGVPPELQFDIKKDIVLEGKEISVIARGYYDYIDRSKESFACCLSGKYIVGEKDGKEYFIFDSTMTEHMFIAEKYGITKILGGGRFQLIGRKTNLETNAETKIEFNIGDESSNYGKDPYQASGFTQKVFESLIQK